MKNYLPIIIGVGAIIGISIKVPDMTRNHTTTVFERTDAYKVTEKELPIPTSPVYASNPVEQEIWEVFGNDAPDAIKIAKCESGMQAARIGDKSLIIYNGEDIVGDSIGVFQIRTGGRDFNRARANGMTPEEFRTWMKDPSENIKYAKSMFDRQGWGPWTCKKVLK